MKRPASIVNEETWRTACSNIVVIAQAVLSGDMGIIEGARKLGSYRSDVKAEKDPDFIFFVGVASETDDLPSGKAESRWNPAALKHKLEEIKKYENSIREQAFIACQNLIEKYK
jgi:Protein of unknown function (DUF2489)